MSESTADQDRIERELRITRARIDGRLTVLQERLSPGQVLDDLITYFRGSDGSDFARNLRDNVRSNPLPVVLSGIGLTWLMASSPHPRTELTDSTQAAPISPASRGGVGSGSLSTGQAFASREELYRRLRDAEAAVVPQEDEPGSAYRDRLVDARATVLGIARNAQETAEAFGKRIEDAASAAMEAVADVGHDLQDRATGASRQMGGAIQNATSQAAETGQAAQQFGRKLLSTLSDNPMLLGAMGLTAGALLGALVPQSEQEESALDGWASQARDAATKAAQEAVDRGGKIAQHVLDAGRDSARSHGLTGEKTVGDMLNEGLSGELVGNVKELAQDLLDATGNAARKDAPPQGAETPKTSATAQSVPTV